MQTYTYLWKNIYTEFEENRVIEFEENRVNTRTNLWLLGKPLLASLPIPTDGLVPKLIPMWPVGTPMTLTRHSWRCHSSRSRGTISRKSGFLKWAYPLNHQF